MRYILRIIILFVVIYFVVHCNRPLVDLQNRKLLALASVLRGLAPPDSGDSVCSGPTEESTFQMANGVISSYIVSNNLTLQNLSTNGTLDTIQRFIEGSCKIAIVQDDLFLHLFDNKGTKDLVNFTGLMEILTPLHSMKVHIVVNKNSNINSIADFNGKKVNLGDKNSGTYITAMQILNTYKFTSTPVYSYDTPSASVSKVVSGEYDAIFYLEYSPTYALYNLPPESNIKLIKVEMSAGENFWYYTDKISNGTYPWQTEDVTTLLVRSLLIKSSDFKDIKVASFLKSVFESGFDYSQSDVQHPGWSIVNQQDSFNFFYNFSVGWNYEAVLFLSSVNKPRTYEDKFCSGDTGSSYDIIANDLITTINSTLGMKLSELNTTGTVENAFSLFDGTCKFGIIGADTNLYLSRHPNVLYNVASFASRVVMPLYFDDVIFLVNKNSNLFTTVSNLETNNNLTWKTLRAAFTGAKINVGLKTSQNYSSAVELLSDFQFDKNSNITFSFKDEATASAQVRNGTIDGTFIVGPYNSAKLGTADGFAANSPVWILPLTFNEYSFANYDSQGFIPANTYPWLNQNIVKVPRIRNFLAINEDGLTNPKIKDLVVAIYKKNSSSEFTSTSLWTQVTISNATEYLKLSKLGAIGWNTDSLNYYLDKITTKSLVKNTFNLDNFHMEQIESTIWDLKRKNRHKVLRLEFEKLLEESSK